MPIFRNNERPVLDSTRGARVSVKRGRLGAGSYWPAGTPIAGNVFGPNNAPPLIPPPPTIRAFGTPGNNSNFTRADQGRMGGEGLPHPNSGFHRTALQNKVQAMTKDGDGVYRHPHGPNPVIQPHEKNFLMHRKVYGVYHTASGASRTLPSDTAFHRVPPKEKPRAVPMPQTNTLAVQKSPERATSFVSRNALWSDPNNSFLGGRKQALTGDTGRGRWSTVKRGAAG